MRSISLSVVALSLAPVLILRIANYEQTGWIITSIIASFWMLSGYWYAMKLSKPIRSHHGYSRRGEFSVKIIGIISLIGFIINSTGLTGTMIYEIYLASLLLSLTVSGMLFKRVLISILKTSTSE